jgi:sugar/nucleoside kinase (ribokinase family)
VRWFHTGGIFAALSETTAEVCIEALKAAKRHGTVTSYDLNYRASLWKSIGGQAKAQEVNREIAKYVDVRTSHRALRVTEDGVICADKDGNEVLVPGNSVICALGQRTKDYSELIDGAPYVRVIGDASRVSTIRNAVYQGYHAALDL